MDWRWVGGAHRLFDRWMRGAVWIEPVVFYRGTKRDRTHYRWPGCAATCIVDRSKTAQAASAARPSVASMAEDGLAAGVTETRKRAALPFVSPKNPTYFDHHKQIQTDQNAWLIVSNPMRQLRNELLPLCNLY